MASTELVTGLDIVQEQFWLAAGRPLVRRRAGRGGTARRARPAMPSRSGSPPRTRPATSPRAPGRIRRWVMPAGPGVRDRHRRRGRRPGPARVRQPRRQDHGPRRRPAGGHRPAPPRARRDRGRRASRRPCRSTGSWPGTRLRGRGAVDRLGGRAVGRSRPSERATALAARPRPRPEPVVRPPVRDVPIAALGGRPRPGDR